MLQHPWNADKQQSWDAEQNNSEFKGELNWDKGGNILMAETRVHDSKGLNLLKISGEVSMCPNFCQKKTHGSI